MSKSSPAFPSQYPVYRMDIYGDSSKYKLDDKGHPIVDHYASGGGLTKREWFAGMALMGIAYAYAEVKGDIDKMTPQIDFEKNLARGALSIADAMIAESEKE